jgi:cyclic pyranopterin phosphate synthase
MKVVDSYGRTLRYLRMAVTGECNLRCTYCRPQGEAALPVRSQLSCDEMLRVAKAASNVGVECIRLTGGEPLLWPELERLVRELRKVSGLRAVAITTNGQLLGDRAGMLARAGLTHINVSLDSLRADRYREICGGELRATMRGVEAALRAGFSRVKINMVVMRGINEDEIEDFVALTKRDPLSVRFIELMPIGGNREFFDEHFVPVDEVEQKAGRDEKLRRIDEEAGYGPARSFAIAGHRGTVGFIGQVSAPRCGECNKLRISSDGMLSPCLFSRERVSLRPALERGDCGAIRKILADGFLNRTIPDSRQTSLSVESTVGMYQIGG